jgi:Holliday junction resolvasome RuvABC DNA-binding subunit
MAQRLRAVPAMNVTNHHIGNVLEETAELLESQQANPFRVRSYRTAARTVRELDEPVAEVFRRGGEGALRQLDGVGTRLASSLAELVGTGRLGLHDRLQSELTPHVLLAQVPGIGEQLAERIHDELDINSLEELEMAAHNGRLARVEGMGQQRIQGIQAALAGMLSGSAARRATQRVDDRPPSPPEPPVATLLDLDRQYRQRAERDQLRRIAPKRFNPNREPWLPIMKVQRGRWEFTLLFSNTRRAHELGKTDDWVVAYYAADHEEGQCTIMTAGRGPLKGRRIIRGREAECRQYYRQEQQQSQTA